MLGVWPSPVKAPALGAGDRRFESCHPDIKIQLIYKRVGFFIFTYMVTTGFAEQ